MINLSCDDCKRPIANTDNRISVHQMLIVDNGKAMNVQGVDFCCRECLNSWLAKNGKVSQITLPNQ